MSLDIETTIETFDISLDIETGIETKKTGGDPCDRDSHETTCTSLVWARIEITGGYGLVIQTLNTLF